MTLQTDCLSRSIILLPIIVILQLSATTDTFAQSPSDEQPQLSDAQKIELKEADEIYDQVVKCYEESKYGEAVTLAERSLKIRERILGLEHPKTATSLNNLALLYQELGNYAAAEPLYQRALKVVEKVLGTEHPDTATGLNNLAMLYQELGNYAAAEPLHQRALKIKERVLGPEHPSTATSLNNLALLYSSQGNYVAAELLHQRALKIVEKALGPEHPNTGASLDNLAVLYKWQSNYAAAEPLYQRALKIREKALGPEHPDTAISLNNLANLYQAMGNDEAAEPLHQRALKIVEKVLGPEHPNTATILNNLAVLYKSQRNYAAAEPLHQRALKIRERALGPEHPDTADSLDNLAELYVSHGRIRKAMLATDQARRRQRGHVARVLPALSARAQENFLRTNYEKSYHRALSLALYRRSDADKVALSTAWLINGKGIAQDALAQRNLLTRDVGDPKLAPIVKELQLLRTQQAALAMNAAEAGQAGERQSRLADLATEEQRLAGQLGGGTGTATTEWIELPEIRKSLPADSVLIDIARFDIFDFKAKEQESKWKPAHYAAWITSPASDTKTVLVDLGDAETIDQLVANIRQRIAEDATKGGTIAKDGEDSAVVTLMKDMSALSDLIWKPLAPHVGDAKQIVLSPDGALWLAPWNALPANDAGTEYLLERYNIRMIISGRDLVATPDERPTTAPVILANPSFDLQQSQKKSALQGIFKTLPSESENVTRSFSAQSTLPKVQLLPNTGIEALAIQPHIEKYTGQKAGLYKEQYALERVAKVLRSPQIVTFATHGFFLPTQETKLEDRTLAMGDSTRSVVLDTNGQLIENPLLRCGLLLSGCNNREASVADDDGILTGMEIVSIDFRGTELVVLSACETGIGDVNNGEGVAGLRQAFQLAGAEAVVSTLWQVPDRDSALLMSKFFEELAAGKSKSEALRNAQLERIQKRRERYGAAHPFFWAAFTLTGE